MLRNALFRFKKRNKHRPARRTVRGEKKKSTPRHLQ